MSDDTATETTGSTWRDLAVARSLDPARARAEKRVQRFLDAALELMTTSTDKEFTVQEVVERSGQSLRSFYQYFAGKYELLLALFEESVRSTAEHLEGIVAEEPDALQRVRRFLVEHHRICQPAPRSKSNKKGLAPAMAPFAQQLLTEHPKEASNAFVPMVSLLQRLLDEAAAAGQIRAGMDHRRLAGVLLQAVMFNAFGTTISGTPLRADVDSDEQLWQLVLNGISA